MGLLKSLRHKLKLESVHYHVRYGQYPGYYQYPGYQYQYQPGPAADTMTIDSPDIDQGSDGGTQEKRRGRNRMRLGLSRCQ